MKIHSHLLSRALKPVSASALTVLLYAGLGAALQGCITATPPPPPAPPAPCVPTASTTFRGGDTFGEELTVTVDPATMGYTISIKASLQRAGAADITGTLSSTSGGCTFASNENGAQFTFGTDGVLLGGVRAPTGGSFLPLLAFQNVFGDPAATSSHDYTSVAGTFNIVGDHYTSTTPASYSAIGRLRNAGTFQLCQDPTTLSFTAYATGCSPTVSGSLTYNSTTQGFDMATTTPAGTHSVDGSAVIGLVSSGSVPLLLVRNSSTSYGMRALIGKQPNSSPPALNAPAADGDFAVVNTDGTNADAVISGSTLTLGATTLDLTYNTPQNQVIEGKSGSTITGHALYYNGIYGFVPVTGTPVFALGVATPTE